ncbi:hypothetical protein CAEBREN_05164 [Caenorhabditis brenneri]|uniref:Uncharacterized protein n=1 Tax=Caenorhabditis brenneri TaxID=135651 RepID=G0PDT4_CAEBE|nr:hypothetical protein CAEBREN_05164 [Caenorhabditis brenneri]
MPLPVFAWILERLTSSPDVFRGKFDSVPTRCFAAEMIYVNNIEDY